MNRSAGPSRASSVGAWGLRRLVLGVGVVLALLCAPARADAGDPYLRFWTLSTPHFRVHYHEGLESIAERAASIAERAHRLLVPHLAGAPDDITNIVLIDDSDSANGIASARPYNSILLYVTAPEDMSALNDYDAAVVEYQQAAELMELSPQLLLNLADALGKTGRYAEMQNTLEQLLQMSQTPVAYERLATSLFKQRDYDAALQNFRRSLELDPNYYPSLNGVGVSMLNRYLASEKQDVEALREGLAALRRSIQIERRQPAVVELIARYG